MTSAELQHVLQVLNSQLRENYGNRVTPALTAGVLDLVNMELRKLVPVPKTPKAKPEKGASGNGLNG